MDIEPIENSAEYLRLIAEIWNAANPPGLAVNARLAAYNLDPATGAETAGRVVRIGRKPVGFAIACALLRPIDGLTHPSGGIEALAVIPEAQQRGIGSRLLAWAEGWLQERGCASARLGGGLRPFAPGLPVECGSEVFFAKHGYAPRDEDGRVWDVARSLAGSRLKPGPGGASTSSETGYAGTDLTPGPALTSKERSLERGVKEVRPLVGSEVAAVGAFMEREFPGRWLYEFRENRRQGDRLEDTLVLWAANEVAGFCQLTLEDSQRPIERFYLHGLPHPWGQLGPIGVGAAYRGQGLGGLLLEGGLRVLREREVDGCVIDWTDLTDFYAKYGFEIHREYRILIKELD